MSIDRSAKGPGKGLMLLLAFFSGLVLGRGSEKKLKVQELGTIAIPGCAELSMEDAASGQLLLECRDDPRKPELFIWDLSRSAVSKQVAANWLPHVRSTVRPSFSNLEPDLFQLFGVRGEVISVVACRVVVLGSSASQLLDLPEDVCDQHSPFFSHLNWCQWVVISSNRQGNEFALATNVGAKPRLLLFRRGSQHPYLEKGLSRYANDVAWSPDGREVTILYSGYVNQNLRWVAVTPGPRVTIPDVVVLDAETGKEKVSFFSGGPEAKLEYSLDGRLIYCISQNRFLGYSWGDWAQETLKVFSAADDALVRTIRLSRNGVRNSFALSPDGRLIAADASTHLFRLLQEPDFAHKMGRFVIFNAETGDTLFDYHAKMNGQITSPIRFAFSPDGRLLFVDFNREGVVSYSVD
jgi:WD40 repeat protein